MAFPYSFNNTIYPAGFLGIDDGAASASFGIDSSSTYAVSVTGMVNKVGDSVILTYGADAPTGYANTQISLTATQYDNAGMIEFTSPAIPPGETTAQTYRYVLSNTQIYGNPPPAGQTRTRFVATANANGTYIGGNYSVSAAPCFTTGTMIRVLRDGRACDVAVEALRVGDLAVTAAGGHRPVRWIGSRSIAPRRHREPGLAQPVRVRADALAPGRPARDLVVSPGHALCLDVLGEVLVPASALVNGATIVREDVAEVTYWHVELDGHDLLLAEGLPCESYLDMGNRGFFAEAGIVDLAASPDVDAGLSTHAAFCRPFHADGPVVHAARARLDARALRLALHVPPLPRCTARDAEALALAG